jgi:UDP-GlcNAc:undecaprenyl-phosphate GlcNAc-1-phosphate transferase
VQPSLISSFALALACSVAATAIVRRFAVRYGLFAMPVGDRWHRKPVPLLGGLAIATGFAAGLLGVRHTDEFAPVLLCTTLMFGLGAVDDIWKIRPLTKLVCQMSIAGLVLSVGPPITITGGLLLDQFLAFVWIVGITNAFNLVDNIDGLSAGLAILASISYLALLAGNGAPALSLCLAAFAGGALGFLIFNFPPASIFMGDCGSFLIGAFLASLSLYSISSLHATAVSVMIVPLLVLAVPIFDTAFVTVTRYLSRRRPWHGGKDHTSHRLVALGVPERASVLCLYAIAAAGSAIAIGLAQLSILSAFAVIGLYAVAVVATGVVLGHVGVHLPAVEAPPAPLVSEVAYKWRLFEMLVDGALLSFAYYAAFRLRFTGPDVSVFFPPFARAFPIVIVSQLAALYAAGKYRQVWRTLGSAELILMLRALLGGVAVALLLLLMLYRFEKFSRGVFLLDTIIAGFLLVGARAVISSIDEYLRKKRATGRAAVIYGAGRGGTLLVRELLQNSDLETMPIGFLDDDPTKQRLRIEGLPVLGTWNDLPAVQRTRGITEVLISIRDLDSSRVPTLLEDCARIGVTLRRMRFSIDDVRGLASVVRHER